MDGQDENPGVLDDGQWLVEHRSCLDRGEAEWLERLARFDREGLWSLDGHFCCGTWLVWKTSMARSTAFEKVRVANELSRRPVVAEAFRRGELSYSAVRAITRMDRPDADVDEALVALARSGKATILDIERVVRAYALYADQDRPPPEDPQPRRDVRIRRGSDGTGEIRITVGDLEVEEFAAALQAFIDQRYRPAAADESSAGDSQAPAEQAAAPTPASVPVDESSAVDSEAPLEQATAAGRRADAFMDMIGAALAAGDHRHAAGDDRYLVHVVVRDGLSTYLDGTPVHPADAAMADCDATKVTHTVTNEGEPLNLGRRTREWSTSQRRAIAVRDGGHCRFPGCHFRHYDIHHLQPWEHGGLTDVANGLCICRRHHRMLHAGYHAIGEANGALQFHRPGGTYVGTTYPVAARTLSFSASP